MTADHWLLIVTLSASTIGLRVLGYLAGSAMMESPFWRRILDIFPGCLVVALIAAALAESSTSHLLAAVASLIAAVLTNNILATMALGMLTFVAIGALI
ncbi:MAG: AzlD domain-containing protein [Pseudomonadota bacterium]